MFHTNLIRFLSRTALGLMVSVLAVSAAWSLAPDKAFHQYIKNTWSIEEGLPQITANAIVQGPRGYIWVGTQAGVSRFDGVRFTNFEPANTPEMPGLFVQALFVDSRDRLWVGTYRGAMFYQDGEFKAVDDGFGRDIDVFEFAETTDGELLMATDRGLLRLSDDIFIRHAGDPAGSLRAVFQHGQMILAGGSGEIFLDRGAGWERTALPPGLATALVNRFAYYDDRIWAATTGGLLYLDGNQWQQFALPGVPDDIVIETIYADRDATLWVGAAGELIRLQGDRLIERVSDDAPFAHGSIRSIAEDHEGSLWLGSQWAGIARLWDSWVFRYDRPEGLHNSQVWSVARDEQGMLWVGTMDGLAVMREGRFEQLTRGSEQPHPHAYTLLPEPDHVWVGTRTGLFWWDRKQKVMVKPDAFSPLDAAQVNGIVQRRDGSYWLATFDGIWRWDGERMQRMAAPDEPGGRDVRTLLETRDNGLLAGTRRGLIEYNDSDARFHPVPGAASGQDVTALLEFDNGDLAVGTLGERLWFRIDGQWHEFGVEHGLPTNSPFALGIHNDVLWVGGIRGIYEMPLSTLDDWLAGRSDDLEARMVLNERGDVPGAQKGHCCNGAGNAKGFMQDGEFWLPSRTGVVHLVPGRISRNDEPPHVAIDRIRIDGQWRSLASGEEPELAPGQRDLAFGFAVLSYQDPGSVQVEYRLDGYNNQWRPLDEPIRRQIIYTNLPAGDFSLQLRASNNAGVWTPQLTQLTFEVAPRLWETAGFQVLLLFLVLMLIWLGFNLRLRNLQRHRKALERTVAERTDALRVANEHLRDYSSRMETASMTDPLTGLWNRRYLLKQLPADLAHFHRQLARDSGKGQSMLFVLVDIDHFKRVNDQRGHGAGDLILQQFAQLLEALVRRGDYIVRWGGEEFLLVFRPMPPEESVRIAQRIVTQVREQAFEPDTGEPVQLSCSVGLSEYPPYRDLPGALSWEDTVALADKALYYVKKHGRDGWCWVRPTPWVEPATLIRRLDFDIDDLISAEQVTVEHSLDIDQEA